MTRREAFAEWWADSMGRHADENVYKTEGARHLAWRAYLCGFIDGLSQRNVTKEQRQKRLGR